VAEATSARAAVEFMNKGIPNVTTLLGGVAAWVESGGRLVRGK